MPTYPYAFMTTAFRFGANPDNVAWYEFLLDPSKLESHLNQADAPSEATLLKDFLQHAEAREEAGKAGLEGPAAAEAQARFKTSRTLRLLSMKTAALIKWNLNIIESIPLPLQKQLFHEMVAAVKLPPLIIENGTLNLSTVLDSLKPYQMGALSLYHRWCLFTLVTNQTKSAPQKVGLIPPTVTMPPSLIVETNVEAIEAVLEELEKMAAISCQILGKIASSSSPVSLPTSECVNVSMKTPEGTFSWDKAAPIPVSEARCQDNYDLGVYLFSREDMDGARECIERAVDLYLSLDLSKCNYCVVREASLRGFALALSIDYDSIKTLRTGKQRKLDFQHTFKDSWHRKDSEILRDLLATDAVTFQLPSSARSQLEVEFKVDGAEWGVDGADFMQEIVYSNAVRNFLADGECVTWNFPLHLALKISSVGNSPESKARDALVLHARKAIDVGTPKAKRLFKGFIVHLLKCGVSVKDLLATPLFSNAEIASIQRCLNRSLVAYQAVVVRPLEFPPPSNQSQVLGSDTNFCFRILQVTQDAGLMKDVVSWRVFDTHKNAREVEGRWEVPRNYARDLNGLPSDAMRNFHRIGIVKVRQFCKLQKYDQAKELIKSMISDLDHMVGSRGGHGSRLRHDFEFELQHVEIKKALFTMKRNLFRFDLRPDILTKLKTMVSIAIQRASTIGPPPPPDLLEDAIALLLNTRHWNDWLPGRPGLLPTPHGMISSEDPLNRRRETRNYLDILWILGKLVYEVSEDRVPSTRTAEYLIQHVLEMFITTNPGSQNYQWVVPQWAFRLFVSKLCHPTVLGVLIAMVSSIVNALKQDSTCEIELEYPRIWPNCRVLMNNSASYSALAATEFLDFCLDHSLKLYPKTPQWVRARADVRFGMGHYGLAMSLYVEYAALHSNFFTSEIPSFVLNETVLRRMISCCYQTRKFTQAAVLCQFLEESEKYSKAFQYLQERFSSDNGCDLYGFIWDVSMLEFLINLHSRRGEELKMLHALKMIKHLDVNSNNSDEILAASVKLKKSQFFRVLAAQHWSGSG